MGAVLENDFARLAGELKDKFGDKVEARYIDTDKSGLDGYPLVAKAVKAGYAFPIVSVNGEPRLAGGLDREDLADILNEEFGL